MRRASADALNKRRLPAPDRLELKVGAKVMFVKNNKPKWINGEIGTVTDMEDDHVLVRKDGSDSVVTVGRESWVKLRYTYDYGTKKHGRCSRFRNRAHSFLNDIGKPAFFVSGSGIRAAVGLPSSR